jgi:hypothetical protein
MPAGTADADRPEPPRRKSCACYPQWHGGGKVISQGGGMGPQYVPLTSMPFMFAGIPPGGFDKGGWLPPHSATLAINNTNRAERVTSPAGEDALLAEARKQNDLLRQQNQLLAQQTAVTARAPVVTGLALGRTLNHTAARASNRSFYATRRPIA